MAEFTGITADRADEILGMSVVSGTINGSGHLILVRANGETIDAGDFTGIVTGILNTTVETEVAAEIPNYVAGSVFTKTLNGALTFPELNSGNIVNALIKGVTSQNFSINVTALPSSPKANTQFAMRVQQDAVGGRTLTLTGFKKSQGVLTLSTAPNAIDIIVFLYDGTSWYAGLMGVDFK